MNNSAEYYIDLLHLEPHKEGGFFYQTYLGDKTNENGYAFSSIYFLLRTGEVSHFHRLQEDELWYYHDGDQSLTIYEIDVDGKLHKIKLGRDIQNGEVLQYLVKKNSIFGSMMNEDGFALVGCMVCPSFSYEHFELFKKEELIKLYPTYSEIINKLGY